MPRTPAQPLPLVAEPGHLIRRAHERAVALFAEHHGRHITPVQYALLRAVHDEPGLDQVTLAERVALDTSTTADIAARLEAKGWLHRELLPRRQRSLRLSEAGQAVRRDVAACQRHVRRFAGAAVGGRARGLFGPAAAGGGPRRCAHEAAAAWHAHLGKPCFCGGMSCRQRLHSAC